MGAVWVLLLRNDTNNSNNVDEQKSRFWLCLLLVQCESTALIKQRSNSTDERQKGSLFAPQNEAAALKTDAKLAKLAERKQFGALWQALFGFIWLNLAFAPECNTNAAKPRHLNHKTSDAAQKH